MEINREIKNITSAFVLEDNLTECVPYGSGHINDTYRLTYGTGKHYILQKMNRSIFTKPVELMENVSGVTGWISLKLLWRKMYVTERQMWKKRFSLCWTVQNWICFPWEQSL